MASLLFRLTDWICGKRKSGRSNEQTVEQTFLNVYIRERPMSAVAYSYGENTFSMVNFSLGKKRNRFSHENFFSNIDINAIFKTLININIKRVIFRN
jgi:hypothetical protein